MHVRGLCAWASASERGADLGTEPARAHLDEVGHLLPHAITVSMRPDGGLHTTAMLKSLAGNPRQIEDILTPLIKTHGALPFNLHLHDTRGQALAMAWAGVHCGVRNFDASIGGLGGCPFAPGASGNVATEDLVYMLNEAGFDTGIDWKALRPAVTLAEELTRQQLGGRVLQWLRSQELRACAPVPEQDI